MSLPQIRKYYGIEVKRGQSVEVHDGVGKVLSAKGMRLRILVNGMRGIYHPTWKIKYL